MNKTQIFHSKVLVTSNKSHDVIHDAFLAVEGEKILEVGPWKKRPHHKSAEIVDATYGMITPGLFNLHTHLPISLLRGIAEDVPLKEWLTKFIFPIERKWVSPDYVRTGARLAACECLRSGITFVADMYFYADAVASTLEEIGLRGLTAQAFFDEGGFDYKSLDESFEGVRKLASRYENHPRIIPALGPHAPYTCSLETLKQTSALAKELNIPIHIHNAETEKELKDFNRKEGKTPTRYLADSGLLDSRFILLAHSLWLEKEDFKLLAKPNVTVVLNPQCNAKLASGVPPVPKFIDHGVRFALGTDGAPSNNTLDIFAEMNFLSKIHHVTEGDLQGLPGPQLFDAVTRTAAEAVGLQDRLGSLEPGKEADFIIIDLHQAHLTPLIQPYSHLIYSIRGSDVESVYVGGKKLMSGRKIHSVDENKIIEDANSFWRKIENSLKAA